MKKLLAIIILSLCFITPSQADDIREFQIEGMSIGDSLLNDFSITKLEEIKSSIDFKNIIHNKYCFQPLKKSQYEDICIYTLLEDKNYKIESISGFLSCPEILPCLDRLNIIDNEIKSLFKNAKRKKYKNKHLVDKTGKSMETGVVYIFPSKDVAGVVVLDYSKEIIDQGLGYEDHMQVFIDSKNYANYLDKVAWE